MARIEVTEHQAHSMRCTGCGEVSSAAFPDGVAWPTQYGPGVKAFVTFCDTYQFLPSERVQEMLYDLTGHTL